LVSSDAARLKPRPLLVAVGFNASVTGWHEYCGHLRCSRHMDPADARRAIVTGGAGFIGSHVFHFGGLSDIVPSIERPLDYMRANVDGTLAVLEAATEGGSRRSRDERR